MIKKNCVQVQQYGAITDVGPVGLKHVPVTNKERKKTKAKAMKSPVKLSAQGYARVKLKPLVKPKVPKVKKNARTDFTIEWVRTDGVWRREKVYPNLNTNNSVVAI